MMFARMSAMYNPSNVPCCTGLVPIASSGTFLVYWIHAEILRSVGGCTVLREDIARQEVTHNQ